MCRVTYLSAPSQEHMRVVENPTIDNRSKLLCMVLEHGKMLVKRWLAANPQLLDLAHALHGVTVIRSAFLLVDINVLEMPVDKLFMVFGIRHADDYVLFSKVR